MLALLPPNAGPATWRPERLSDRVRTPSLTLILWASVGWIVIGAAVLAIVAVILYLFRQWRMSAPPPPDLLRSGDGTRDDYSTFEEGHDIATGFVERGGSL